MRAIFTIHLSTLERWTDRLLSWLSDGSEFEIAGHSALHSLAVERRRAKVRAAQRAIADAWREYKRTMQHGEFE